MTFADIPFRPTQRTLRQFAAVWLLFFLAWAYRARAHPALGIGLAIMAVVVGCAGLVRPGLVRWIFVGWMVLAFPIGWIVSQVMLLMLFYVVLTPAAVLFRLRGRDLLRRKPNPGCATFWLPKETPADVKSYFRQY